MRKPANGGDDEVLFKTDGKEVITLTSLSQDGRTLLFTMAKPGARSPDVFVRPFARPGTAPAAGTKWQVSPEASGYPQWRAGGRQLSYVSGPPGAGRVLVVDVLPSDSNVAVPAFNWGPPRPLMSLPKGSTLFAYTGDGKRLLAAIPVETNAPPRPLTVVMNWLTGIE